MNYTWLVQKGLGTLWGQKLPQKTVYFQVSKAVYYNMKGCPKKICYI